MESFLIAAIICVMIAFFAPAPVGLIFLWVGVACFIFWAIVTVTKENR